MDARTLGISTIFGQDRWHVVPLYQRPYVWKQTEQWERLWDDIRSVAERVLARQEVHAHFLGAYESMVTAIHGIGGQGG